MRCFSSATWVCEYTSTELASDRMRLRTKSLLAPGPDLGHAWPHITVFLPVRLRTPAIHQLEIMRGFSSSTTTPGCDPNFSAPGCSRRRLPARNQLVMRRSELDETFVVVVGSKYT